MSKQAKSQSNANITLRRAAQTGNLQKIREAHAAGADLNSHDHGEELGKCCWWMIYILFFIDAIITANDSVDTNTTTSSSKDSSATELPSIELSTLKTNEEKEADEKVIKNKAKIDASRKAASDSSKINTGDTPLHYACENNYLEAAGI